MASRERENEDREREREAERYRRATREALNQLDWCIDYLYGLRKTQIARTLARNRRKIIERAGL